ncbi:hypothetical protein AGR13a_Lc50026 [Agrobacterium genomosp. 13 str. CFBP 6927]|uniref:Transposase n=1 Tax=Agrobacterium genomosp. 13 str. CFBP 6927 TaxID=1183428 RepID=A0ABM9VLK4_9HYPH|nr:hypothetical protein AGR13a_Lc50026 [Agrobacterium genomosp. 13 str. CFBP 6927]
MRSCPETKRPSQYDNLCAFLKSTSLRLGTPTGLAKQPINGMLCALSDFRKDHHGSQG